MRWRSKVTSSGTSVCSAFASLALNESLRRLPTRTAILRGMTAPWRVARRGSDPHLHQRGVNRRSRPLLEIHPRRAPASPIAAATTGDKGLVYNFYVDPHHGEQHGARDPDAGARLIRKQRNAPCHIHDTSAHELLTECIKS